MSIVAPMGTRTAPLVCVPGGPLLPSAYLRDLGGLSEHAPLVFTEPPVDPASSRCDVRADALESVRVQLGVERLDLLGHSAGANVVLRYAERYPARVARLLLVTPSTRAVGIDIDDEARSAVARNRVGEPWYEDAAAALERIRSGDPLAADWDAIAPFSHGRWDAAAAAYDAQMNAQLDPVTVAAFGADGAFDPPATRSVLASLAVPVTIIAGSVDVGLPPSVAEEFAGLFPDASVTVLDGAGHFPWGDVPEAFVAAAVRALRAGTLDG